MLQELPIYERDPIKYVQTPILQWFTTNEAEEKHSRLLNNLTTLNYLNERRECIGTP